MSDNSTILLVDDDEDIRHVLRILFEIEGYRVVGEAADGLEAIGLAPAKRPDFVVLDAAMPNLDGAEAARFLRVILPDSRIVAFSATLDGKPDWADAYLNKNRISEIVPLLGRLMESVA